MRYFYLLVLLFCLANGGLRAQSDTLGWRWLEPADTFDQGRFWPVAGTGALIYGGFAYGLYQTWYRDFELTGFHYFNDWGEWRFMDKAGHTFTAYTEARASYAGARWTGMSPRAARWTAFGIANFLQGTIEVMDGFSEKWGFSWSDIGFNVLGASTFMVQDILWQEQRILLKVSSNLRPHPDRLLLGSDGETRSSLALRSSDLYGTSYVERFLKDYNTMTIWASVNVRDFLPDSPAPVWLNLAVGYGSENLYGGYTNSWIDDNGVRYHLSPDAYPRYGQLFLSPDIDFTRIPTRKRWVKLLLGAANFLKFPAPALEINGQGGVKFHPIYF